MTTHEVYMLRCIELAQQGVRAAMPNPGVGAVIVHGETIIGEGYTAAYGGAHAEVNAIRAVADKRLLRDSTLYVSLEPCSHYGKTPPCTNLIIESGIPRIMVGIQDPFKAVNGSGFQQLRKAGMEVTAGILQDKCYEVNKRFFTFHQRSRPYVILKWAQSLDGFLAPERINYEKGIHWITRPGTKTLTHQWRADEMAIAVGTNTVRTDNPALTVRHATGKNPLRVVLDKNLSLPGDLNVFREDADTLILNQLESRKTRHLEYLKVDFSLLVPELLNALKERNVLSVIIEGGGQLLRSFLEAGIWDEARVLTGRVAFRKGLPAPVISAAPVVTYPYGEDQVAVYAGIPQSGTLP